ncbi:3-oxo-5a-steroid 4- dehydrogenase [Thoreauomyces humboldtii]|nr:3-oxo-5a-steroid 4- dehydrogenase [Thoreauomyces humboldtii]
MSSTSSFSVQLTSRKSKNVIRKIDVAKPIASAKVADLKAAIAKAFPKWYPSRQRLTFGEKNVALEHGKSLSDYGVKNGDAVMFKDLGPQIGWTTVFLIEYLGPLLIHPMLYYLPSIFYPGSAPAPHTRVQTLTMILCVLHFLKREYETLFVHRFSNDTMPITNLPKNCFHYWVLGGLFLGYPVYSPGFTGGYLGGAKSDVFVYTLVGVWAWAEVSNYLTHVTLRNLRPAGSRVRNIPHGYGFDWVSCPNYFFEIVGWFAIALLTGSVPAYAFFAGGAGQMWQWAVKKHLRYKKEFGAAYPRSRKVLIPFVA